jgi:hypothetical protein
MPTAEDISPAPLKAARWRSFSFLGEVRMLPFVHGLSAFLVTVAGGFAMFLASHQNERVQTLRERNPIIASHSYEAYQLHSLTEAQVGTTSCTLLLLAMLSTFTVATVRLTQKSLADLRNSIREAESMEAFLTARPETEPAKQRIVQPLQEHIQSQVKEMAGHLAQTAQGNLNVQYELGVVFGPEHIPPSEKILTRLFHYLTTVSIRHAQQQATDGQPPAPLSESEYLIKMAALVEMAKLRGNPFESLAEKFLPEEADKTPAQPLEPRMLKLLALAETRIRYRAEQWADDALEQSQLQSEAQQLREQLSQNQGAQRASVTPEQLQAFGRLEERLHLLTHRPYPPVFSPEEVEPLGLTLPLEALEGTAPHQEPKASGANTETPETLSARLDTLLQDLNREVETLPPQSKTQET